MDENPYKSPEVAHAWSGPGWLRKLAAYCGIRIPVKCSFCGEPWKPGQPLAEGVSGVYICRSCTGRCTAILDEELRRLNGGAETPA
jgi:hypothetical protein